MDGKNVRGITVMKGFESLEDGRIRSIDDGGSEFIWCELPKEMLSRGSLPDVVKKAVEKHGGVYVPLHAVSNGGNRARAIPEGKPWFHVNYLNAYNRSEAYAIELKISACSHLLPRDLYKPICDELKEKGIKPNWLSDFWVWTWIPNSWQNMKKPSNLEEVVEYNSQLTEWDNVSFVFVLCPR